MLYDKNDETYGPWGFLAIIVLCCVLLVLCSGCTSGADAVDSDILQLERRIAELETINGELTERLGKAEDRLGRAAEIASNGQRRISDIQATAASISDGLERIEYLFGCYEYEATRIISEINSCRAYDIDLTND